MIEKSEQTTNKYRRKAPYKHRMFSEYSRMGFCLKPVNSKKAVLSMIESGGASGDTWNGSEGD